MSDESFKRHDGAPHTGLTRSAPYPMSRLARPYDLVDLAREIERADTMMTNVVGGKLGLIADQIRRLQEQAEALLKSAERDAALHRVECRFAKQPGCVYHLYRRADDGTYFSLLAPADWNHHPPHAFEGSFRLQTDMSFVEVIEEG